MKNAEIKHSELNKQPVIDFTTLPLIEAALMLRTLGEKLLLSLIRGKARPDLAALLTVEQTRMLVWSRSKNQQNLQRAVQAEQSPKHFVARFFDILRGTISWKSEMAGNPPHLDLIPITNQAIEGKLSPAMWYTQTWHQTELHFGATSPFYVPDDFWQVVTELACRDLYFRRRVANEINSYLKRRVLMTSGDMPTAVLSPKTYWILINLADSNSNQLIIKEAVSRLRAEGKRQSLTNNWASFWDQWVISEALQHWPEAFNQLDSQLRAAIFELPLLAIISQKRLENFRVEANRNTVNMIISSWTDADIPEWIYTLLR